MSEITKTMESLSWKSYYMGQIFMANVMKRSLLSMIKDIDESITMLENKSLMNDEQFCYDCHTSEMKSVWRDGYWYCDKCGNKTKGNKWVFINE